MTVKRVWELLRPPFISAVILRNAVLLRAEPRGFEPPTSALQRQIHNVAIVRWRPKNAAKLRTYLQKYSWLFVWVGVLLVYMAPNTSREQQLSRGNGVIVG